MMKKNVVFSILAVLLLLFVFLAFGAFGSLSGKKECLIFIHRNSTLDDVYEQIDKASKAPQRSTFHMMARLSGYASNIQPGCYDIGSGTSTIMVLRRLATGRQTPRKLTIPCLRTAENLADFLGEQLEMPADSFYKVLTDSTILAEYGLEKATSVCLFIPNTYEVYWTITPKHLMNRMKRESNAFWTSERCAKLLNIIPGFTKTDAITLASIVEQETQYQPERAMVAGMYINRLRRNMPLQADPTVKFALQDFTLRRILHEHLQYESPYNTYKNTGLPPGPICIPSISSIDAVLNFAHHNYIYMCAKEDFSGAHNFAADYSTHLANARKYATALDNRGIH